MRADRGSSVSSRTKIEFRISALQLTVLRAVIFILTLQLTTRRLVAMAAIALVGALYLANLTAMGLVSKDEPRYADIGRAMAASGDWVTPRLWGQPWFEKPALLYWLVGAGFKLGLNEDLAPRLPVAVLSLAFLVFFWYRLRSLWDAQVATYATAILATSAGWLAYSHVAVTDLPLAVCFSTALVLSLGPKPNRPLAAIALGLATLAKSLVPVVLFLPVLAVDYRSIRQWVRPAPVVLFALTALPWYIVCFLRNGHEFIDVLFVQQQFSRFHSANMHPQPIWFYVPVLLMLLYPWFPLLLLVPRRFDDRRVLTLAAVVLFGFLFFSVSVNKLPSYVLPLVPSVSVLVGLGLRDATGRQLRLAVIPIALIAALPVVARTLPAALAGGLRSSPIAYGMLAVWLTGGAVAAMAVHLIFRGRGFFATAFLTALAFVWFEATTFPAIDAAASARPLWLKTRPDCVSGTERGLIYGMNYYAGRALKPCAVLDQPAPQIVR